MSKQDIFRILQLRLREAFDATHLSISEFARVSGVDRSTLSQLLSPDAAFRLPRADTIALIARHLNVSADWLLGLSEIPNTGMDVINQALSVKRDTFEEDNQWIKWHREAGDAKIRYVTVSSIPHHLKLSDTIQYEFTPIFGVKGAANYARGPVFQEEIQRRTQDYEVCASQQSLQSFAEGTWIWDGYPASKRRAQLEHMTDQLEALYPDYQMYIFDELKILSLPILIFGNNRAALNCNGTYLSFTRADHIAFFTDQFKSMIRNAVVHPHEAAAYIRKLAGKVK